MTLTDQDHQSAAEARMSVLVAESRAHTAAYLRRRHIVRCIATAGCCAVFVWGYLSYAFGW